MWLAQLFKNTIILKLFTFPILTVVGTIILRFYIKDKIKVAGIFLIFYAILMLILFNKNFFVYVLLYPILSLITYRSIENLENKMN